MTDFGEYAPNRVPKDALVVRKQELAPAHAADAYAMTTLAQGVPGPANPYGTSSFEDSRKRKKGVLTGYAEETVISEDTFRSKHRAVERQGGPERGYQSSKDRKAEAARLRGLREAKGDASVVEGPGSYRGPWAKYETKYTKTTAEVAQDGVPLPGGGGGAGGEEEEEYEIVEVTDEEEEDDNVVASGLRVRAPQVALEKREEVAKLGEAWSKFHGTSEHDYQGRTYLHVPQDLDVDLRKEPGEIDNYLPKRQIHAWKDPAGAQPITALRLFPRSSHLVLAGSADSTVRLYDAYHERELLRSFHGHTKALSDLCFNHDGTRFLSASWDRQIKLWDTETGQCLAKYSSGKTPHVVRFQTQSAEHQHEFLAGMSNHSILQYDTRVGASDAAVQDYDHHLSDITTLTMFDGGRRFLSSSNDKTVRVWDYGIPVPTKLIAEVDQFAYTRSCLHPNGKHILYQSSDNTIVAYSTGEKVRQNRKKEWRGHHTAGTAIDVCVSPDGQYVTSADTGGSGSEASHASGGASIVIWDYKRGKEVQRLRVGKRSESYAVTCLAWSEQETSKLFTAGQDGQIRLWD